MGGGTIRKERIGLTAWQQGLVFLAACAVLVTRRPDAIFHAQFWAEDGHVFFADAYNLGWWTAIFRAYDGYFHLAPRLAASVALLVPLRMAPLTTNLIAIGIQALPVNLLLGARSAAWGSLRYRFWLSAIFLALPNCSEISFGITNSQWLIALSAFLLIVASGAQGRAGRIADLCFLVLAGMTGPFCIFLLPIAVFVAIKRRVPWRWAPAGAIAACCLVQVWCLLIMDPAGRPNAPLGASLGFLMKILGGHIYIATLLGGNGLAVHASPPVAALLVAAAVVGTALLAICFVRSGLEMKLFILFAAAILTASLISPTAYPPPPETRWHAIAGVIGIRYWYFPTLACAWSVLWAAHSRIQALQALSVLLLVGMCVGVVRDWRQPGLEEFKFAEYAAQFDAARPGTAMTIPLNPDGWNMQLVKHASR